MIIKLRPTCCIQTNQSSRFVNFLHKLHELEVAIYHLPLICSYKKVNFKSPTQVMLPLKKHHQINKWTRRLSKVLSYTSQWLYLSFFFPHVLLNFTKFLWEELQKNYSVLHWVQNYVPWIRTRWLRAKPENRSPSSVSKRSLKSNAAMKLV